MSRLFAKGGMHLMLCLPEILYTCYLFPQYHRGRLRQKRWVFGMVDMNSPTRPIFLHVASRDAPSLQSIIRQYIPDGSTIVSDGWRGYYGIDNYNNYQHLIVNHARHFVDPNTGNLTL